MKEKPKIFNVLFVDALLDSDTWTWNSWHVAAQYSEEFEGILNEENALRYFINEYIVPGREKEFEILDDQTNLVLIKKDTQRPCYAIDYSSLPDQENNS